MKIFALLLVLALAACDSMNLKKGNVSIRTRNLNGIYSKLEVNRWVKVPCTQEPKVFVEDAQKTLCIKKTYPYKERVFLFFHSNREAPLTAYVTTDDSLTNVIVSGPSMDPALTPAVEKAYSDLNGLLAKQ